MEQTLTPRATAVAGTYRARRDLCRYRCACASATAVTCFVDNDTSRRTCVPPSFNQRDSSNDNQHILRSHLSTLHVPCRADPSRCSRAVHPLWLAGALSPALQSRRKLRCFQHRVIRQGAASSAKPEDQPPSLSHFTTPSAPPAHGAICERPVGTGWCVVR